MKDDDRPILDPNKWKGPHEWQARVLGEIRLRVLPEPSSQEVAYSQWLLGQPQNDRTPWRHMSYLARAIWTAEYHTEESSELLNASSTQSASVSPPLCVTTATSTSNNTHPHDTTILMSENLLEQASASSALGQESEAEGESDLTEDHIRSTIYEDLTAQQQADIECAHKTEEANQVTTVPSKSPKLTSKTKKALAHQTPAMQKSAANGMAKKWTKAPQVVVNNKETLERNDYEASSGEPRRSSRSSRTNISTYNVKRLAGTAIHTPRKHLNDKQGSTAKSGSSSALDSAASNSLEPGIGEAAGTVAPYYQKLPLASRTAPHSTPISGSHKTTSTASPTGVRLLPKRVSDLATNNPHNSSRPTDTSANASNPGRSNKSKAALPAGRTYDELPSLVPKNWRVLYYDNPADLWAPFIEAQLQSNIKKAAQSNGTQSQRSAGHSKHCHVLSPASTSQSSNKGNNEQSNHRTADTKALPSFRGPAPGPNFDQHLTQWDEQMDTRETEERDSASKESQGVFSNLQFVQDYRQEPSPLRSPPLQGTAAIDRPRRHVQQQISSAPQLGQNNKPQLHKKRAAPFKPPREIPGEGLASASDDLLIHRPVTNMPVVYLGSSMKTSPSLTPKIKMDTWHRIQKVLEIKSDTINQELDPSHFEDLQAYSERGVIQGVLRTGQDQNRKPAKPPMRTSALSTQSAQPKALMSWYVRKSQARWLDLQSRREAIRIKVSKKNAEWEATQLVLQQYFPQARNSAFLRVTDHEYEGSSTEAVMVPKKLYRKPTAKQITTSASCLAPVAQPAMRNMNPYGTPSHPVPHGPSAVTHPGLLQQRDMHPYRPPFSGTSMHCPCFMDLDTDHQSNHLSAHTKSSKKKKNQDSCVPEGSMHSPRLLDTNTNLRSPSLTIGAKKVNKEKLYNIVCSKEVTIVAPNSGGSFGTEEIMVPDFVSDEGDTESEVEEDEGKMDTDEDWSSKTRNSLKVAGVRGSRGRYQKKNMGRDGGKIRRGRGQ